MGLPFGLQDSTGAGKGLQNCRWKHNRDIFENTGSPYKPIMHRSDTVESVLYTFKHLKFVATLSSSCMNAVGHSPMSIIKIALS